MSTIVTPTSVVSPAERFLPLADEVLLEYFQDGCSDEESVQLTAFHAMVAGMSTHEYQQLRKRLEGHFSYFSRGTAGSLHSFNHKRQPGQKDDSLEEKEQGFLEDFQQLMAFAHYKQLSKDEWQAASSEEFLFTLPVSIRWEAMDDKLLKKYWQKRPKEREELPELADRILIWHRGVMRARMGGRYMTTKLELLVSFLLLQPLWRALVALLTFLGLSAPAPPPMPHAGDPAAPNLKSVSIAAQAAVKLRRAVRRERAMGSTTLKHEARVVVERRTLNRAFPNARAVLRQLFRRVELQEACFSDVVVLYRRAAGAVGQREVRLEGEGEERPSNIALRHFRGIPLADLELIMPEKTIFVPPSVFLQLLAAVVMAVVGLIATFFQTDLNVKVWGSAFVLLASRASGVYFQAQSERAEIEREMNRLLLERLGASQEAVLHTLTEEVCRQRIRELLVAYCVLRGAEEPVSDDELDCRCERLLRRAFGLALDFTAEMAIPKLLEWGLATRDGEGNLVAAPLEVALLLLDKLWDNQFDYHEKYPGTEGLGSDSSANSPDDGRPPLTDGKGKKQDGQLLPLSESRQWQAKRKGSSGCKEARPAGGSAAGEQEQQAAAALGEDESAALGDNEQQQGPQGSRDVHVPKGDGVEEQQEEEQPPPEMGGGQEQEEVDEQPAEEEEEPPEVDVSDSLLSTSSSAEYVALRTPLVPPTRSSPIKPTITHLVHLRKGGMGRAH